MPIALLLHSVSNTLRLGVAGTPRVLGLGRWVELVSLEEVLLGRARGAFMVRWFGTRFPMRGSSLHGYIVNLGALRERFLAVQRSLVPEPTGGINLLEPLAGLAGIAAGVVLSPTGLILIHYGARQLLPGWMQQISGLLVGPIGGALAAAAGVLALPLAFLWGLATGIQGPGELRSLHEALGAAARLVESFTGFMNVLLGPREQVRNPLLRAILEVFDGLARLVPFSMALFAVLVSRVGGLIVPLTRQGIALLELKDELVATLQLIVSDIGYSLSKAFTGPESPLGVLLLSFRAIRRSLATVGSRLAKLLRQISSTYQELGPSVRSTMSAHIGKAQRFLRLVFEEHPLGSAITAFIKQVTVIRSAAARLPPSPPPSSSSGGGFSIPSWVPLPRPPPTPSLPELPSPDEIARRMGGLPKLEQVPLRVRVLAFIHPFFEERPSLSPEAQAGLAGAHRLESVFARQRRELERETGLSPAALAELRAREVPLREALTAVVARVVPPELRVYLPELLGVFQALDEALHERPPEAAPAAFPVRELPDTGLLRPVVHRLHIRHPGAYGPRVREFRDMLVRKLGQQQYPAQASG